MSESAVQSIWDHLEELAQRLRKIVFSIIIATFLFALLPSDISSILRLDFTDYRPLVLWIIEKVQVVLLPEEVNLIAFNWLDTFYIYAIVSVALGAIITLPITANEIYQFLSPALYPNEKKSMIWFVLAFLVLFILGILYAFYLLLPITFQVLYRLVYQSRVIPFFSVKDFFDMVTLGLVGSGIFYTFPLVLYMLVRAGLLEVNTLKQNRKQVFIIMLVVTAILPDPTPITMFLMTIPFYVLYEATIQILVRTTKPKDELIIERGILRAQDLISKVPPNESTKSEIDSQKE